MIDRDTTSEIVNSDRYAAEIDARLQVQDDVDKKKEAKDGELLGNNGPISSTKVNQGPRQSVTGRGSLMTQTDCLSLHQSLEERQTRFYSIPSFESKRGLVPP